MIYERQVHRRVLLQWGAEQENTLVLTGDLTASCEADAFRDAFPDRFISMGMMEQNMMSFAAGLAREDLVPLVHTFGVFMYRRALDQIEMSIAYADLPVRMFGFLPGVTTPGGPSHQATDDVAIMRALPNMTVVEPGDATDMEGLPALARQVPGPIYFRMSRGDIPRLFPPEASLALNSARILSEGTDLALLTSGACTAEALRVIDILKDEGLGIQHLHISTFKPFSDPKVVEALGKVRYGAITMENHTSIGGLGSCVAETLAQNGLPGPLVKLAIDDCYMQGASQRYLMKTYGIDATALIDAVNRLTGTSIQLSDTRLAGTEERSFAGDNQLEAL